MGRVPGLFGVLAESPNTLKAYTQLHQAFSYSSFDAEELTVVWQTITLNTNVTTASQLILVLHT